jgi:hypothetical protein
MIIQKQKPFETIEETLKPYTNVFIAGCADCATACKTGGEEELAAMKAKLTELGKTITGMMVYDTACMLGEVRKKCAEVQEQIDAADAILVLCCGSGVQTLGDYLEDTPVVPGVDALFIGETIRAGKYKETCQACGKCVLDLTDGICPVTRCAKGLLNGPCGGSQGGLCEVSMTLKCEVPCVWALIYDRLSELGELDRLTAYCGPKDWRPAGSSGPRQLVRPDH